ncbi:MAG: aryl-sulfate sulfotransferase [Bdellovibrionales bacterium]|nr:aryl-sulfate sulfotransferase [Bdellovibrionales bacterium]
MLLLPSAQSHLESDAESPIANEPSHESPNFIGKLNRFDANQSYTGFTLYPTTGNAKVFLLNMSGTVVHEWNVDADRARLLENGNLLVVHGSKWGTRVSPWNTLKYTVREYTWNGDVVWEYSSPYRVHHDVQRLANGNTLFPVRRMLPPEYHALISEKRRHRIDQIRTDSILEVTPKGELAWEWRAEEYLDVTSCGAAGCENENPADWTHMNTTNLLPNNKWYLSGDSRFHPGNVLAVLRNWWEIIIIDRDSKEVAWKYTGNYKGGLSGGHDAYMIPEPLPGAGNILTFDNGRSTHKGESYILEIEPPTGKLVWVYDAGKNFHSNSAGSVQRLPNGNTLIAEDLSGRTFEVTSNGEIVWEFDGNLRTARPHRYSPHYCPQFENLQINS